MPLRMLSSNQYKTDTLCDLDGIVISRPTSYPLSGDLDARQRCIAPDDRHGGRHRPCPHE